MSVMTRYERFELAIKEQHADVDYLMAHADFCNTKGALTQDEFDALHALAYPVVETPEEAAV